MREAQMKTTTVFLLLAALSTSRADDAISPPADVRITMEQYWNSVKAGKVDRMWVESSATTRGNLDIKNFKARVQGKDFRIRYGLYRPFEKDKIPHATVNVTLQTPTGEHLLDSDGCYYLKKVRGRFKVVDYLGDCLN